MEQSDVLIISSYGLKTLQIVSFLHRYDLSKINIFCGTSFGSVVCLLLVCGYTVDEIIHIILKDKIISDISCIGLLEIMSGDIYFSSIEPVKKKLSEYVIQKLGNIPNLYNLYLQTGKILCTSVMNLTSNTPEIFDYQNRKSISCIDAVIFSMNIPFLFYELQYNHQKLIDGLFGDPIPIDYFNDGHHKISVLCFQRNQEDLKKLPILKKLYSGIFNLIDLLLVQKIYDYTEDENIFIFQLISSVPNKMSNDYSPEEKGKFIAEGYNYNIVKTKQTKNIKFQYPV